MLHGDAGDWIVLVTSRTDGLVTFSNNATESLLATNAALPVLADDP
jgi:hypothetical protein